MNGAERILTIEEAAMWLAKMASERDAAIAERNETKLARDKAVVALMASRTECSAMQSALDAAMVEHSTLEAERARLAKALDGERAANTANIAELHQDDAEIGTVRREREALRAQLASLAAEHESAARAAEEKLDQLNRQVNLFGKTLQRIHLIADDCSVSTDPEDDPLAEIQELAGDALDGCESPVGPNEAASIRASQEVAALAEVKP